MAAGTIPTLRTTTATHLVLTPLYVHYTTIFLFVTSLFAFFFLPLLSSLQIKFPQVAMTCPTFSKKKKFSTSAKTLTLFLSFSPQGLACTRALDPHSSLQHKKSLIKLRCDFIISKETLTITLSFVVVIKTLY